MTLDQLAIAAVLIMALFMASLFVVIAVFSIGEDDDDETK